MGNTQLLFQHITSELTHKTMKTTLILALVVITLSLVEAASLQDAKSNPDVQCTEYCKADNGDFPLACCSHFFCKCERGVGWVIKCPADLYFVESTDQCDYKYNVECCNAK